MSIDSTVYGHVPLPLCLTLNPRPHVKRDKVGVKKNCIAIDSECSKMDNSEKRVGRENTFKDLYILGILNFFCKYL